jgi:4-hydroxybenzoate polyprenyltransferase
LPALVLSLANALWVMGFDVVYAIQDIDFDRKAGLFSIPARFGKRVSLAVSATVHAAAVAALALFGVLTGLGVAFFIGVAAIAFLLGWAALAARVDYRKNVLFASYSANQVVSVTLLVATLVEFMR